jgi:hypothetical protein
VNKCGRKLLADRFVVCKKVALPSAAREERIRSVGAPTLFPKLRAATGLLPLSGCGSFHALGNLYCRLSLIHAVTPQPPGRRSSSSGNSVATPPSPRRSTRHLPAAAFPCAYLVFSLARTWHAACCRLTCLRYDRYARSHICAYLSCGETPIYRVFHQTDDTFQGHQFFAFDGSVEYI